MKKVILIMVIISIFLAQACGGRTLAPVMISQFGDDSKSLRCFKV